MAANRGILLEIEGSTYAFTFNETSITANYGQTVVEAICPPVPRTQPMIVNPFDGSYETGGVTIKLSKVADILLNRKTSPTTVLSSDLDDSSSTINVESTTGFPSSGTIWIDGEAITYTGSTGTSFTSASRGQYGTTAAAHASTVGSTAPLDREVFGFNPFVLGRRCWLYWYDYDDTSDTTRVYTGFIDAFNLTRDGFELSIVNGQKFLEESRCMAGAFAEGTLSGAGVFVGGTSRVYQDLGIDNSNILLVNLEDENNPFPDIDDLTTSSTSSQQPYIQIDEEILSYRDDDYPYVSSAINNPSSAGSRLYFDIDDDSIQEGDMIKFTGASGAVRRGLVVEKATGSASYPQRIYHSASENPSAGNTVTTPLKQALYAGIQRGLAETTAAEHKIGAKIKEVRIVSGDHVDCILRLLMSIDGDSSNGKYDTLPTGWGAGLSSSLVDADSFEEKLADYSEYREFLFTGPVDPNTLLSDLARATSSRIYWNQSGQLTVEANRDLYPTTTSGISTLDINDLQEGALPIWRIRQSNIYNSWTWRGNAPKGGDFKDSATFAVQESIDRHKERPLPDYEDGGLQLSRDLASMELVATATLRRWAFPCIWLDLEIMVTEDDIFPPGTLFTVDFSHLPDLAGTAGLSSTFEVMEFVPQSEQGTALLVLAQMPAEDNTGLVAPACEVSSVSDPVVTMKSASDTHFSDTDDGTALGEITSGNTEDGKEDVDYFAVDYEVTFWDVSTLGNSPPTTADATITAIDYATREVTVSSVPAWLAAGDLMRLSDWDDVKANDDILTSYCICLADETASPVSIGTAADDPFVWGL